MSKRTQRRRNTVVASVPSTQIEFVVGTVRRVISGVIVVALVATITLVGAVVSTTFTVRVT